MRHAILLAALWSAVILSNCGSSADPALVRQRIVRIKTWHLSYSSRLDPNETRSLKETATMQPAQVDRNLRFADLASEVLKQRFGVPVVEDSSAASGEIRITMTESLNGPPKYANIALYDSNSQFITRAKVWIDTQARIAVDQSNPQRDPHLFNQALAAYVAEGIVDLLVAKQTGTR